MIRSRVCHSRGPPLQTTIKHQFREAVAVVLAHMFQLMCMNVSRQRRRIRSLLREGPSMTQVAAELDNVVT